MRKLTLIIGIFYLSSCYKIEFEKSPEHQNLEDFNNPDSSLSKRKTEESSRLSENKNNDDNSLQESPQRKPFSQ